MQSASTILINHLTYFLPNDKALFKDFSCAFSAERVGLIGKNGMGKTTLLKLIIGELQANAGSIEIIGSIAYCPQLPVMLAEQTVADFLNISEKIQALEKIMQGSINTNDFTVVGSDWDIRERTQLKLAEFGLTHLALAQSFTSLSGGEKTRLALARVFLANADFIILDEPTNNLDAASRDYLYQAISCWKKGLLVVSHDRALLNLMDTIMEITSLGVNFYGGNYDDFVEQKSVHQQALQRELLDAKKELTNTKATIQATRERSEQKKSYGRKQFLSGKVDRMLANSLRGRSEKTQSRHAKLKENLIKNSEKKLVEAQEKIEIQESININLPKTFVPNGKMVLEIEDLVFSYPDCSRPLIDNFNLKIMGPERIALIGENGSGKTTLIKLILNQLEKTSGKIFIGVDQVKYLDQSINTLEGELSILDNFLKLNPDKNQRDAYHALAQFLFRNTAALKQVKNLSGGERLRAELACMLMSNDPPQLLILDEPTNHLDLESIANIESALKHFCGAMIVISHDQVFLNNIQTKRIISLQGKNYAI